MNEEMVLILSNESTPPPSPLQFHLYSLWSARSVMRLHQVQYRNAKVWTAIANSLALPAPISYLLLRPLKAFKFWSDPPLPNSPLCQPIQENIRKCKDSGVHRPHRTLPQGTRYPPPSSLPLHPPLSSPLQLSVNILGFTIKRSNLLHVVSLGGCYDQTRVMGSRDKL